MSIFCVKCTIFGVFVKFLFKTLLILTITKVTDNFQFCRNPNLVILISKWRIVSLSHRHPLIFGLDVIFIDVLVFLAPIARPVKKIALYRVAMCLMQRLTTAVSYHGYYYLQGNAILIDRIGDANSPYFVSGKMLEEISEFLTPLFFTAFNYCQ